MSEFTRGDRVRFVGKVAKSVSEDPGEGAEGTLLVDEGECVWGIPLSVLFDCFDEPNWYPRENIEKA